MTDGAYPFDHVMWAAADLDAACTLFERNTGVKPDPGGSHAGLGTRNRLTGLSGTKYFEIIAPDPGQPIAGTFAQPFLNFQTPRIHALIYATSDLERVQAVYRQLGIHVDIIDGSRMRSDGRLIRWRMLAVEPGPLSAYVPRFLDWLDSPHPSAELRHECSLRSLRVLHPEPAALAAIWKAHGLNVSIAAGPPGFSGILATPHGEVAV